MPNVCVLSPPTANGTRLREAAFRLVCVRLRAGPPPPPPPSIRVTSAPAASGASRFGAAKGWNQTLAGAAPGHAVRPLRPDRRSGRARQHEDTVTSRRDAPPERPVTPVRGRRRGRNADTSCRGARRRAGATGGCAARPPRRKKAPGFARPAPKRGGCALHGAGARPEAIQQRPSPREQFRGPWGLKPPTRHSPRAAPSLAACGRRGRPSRDGRYVRRRVLEPAPPRAGLAATAERSQGPHARSAQRPDAAAEARRAMALGARRGVSWSRANASAASYAGTARPAGASLTLPSAFGDLS